MTLKNSSIIALFSFILLFTFSCTDDEEMGFQFPAKFVYDKVEFETFDHYEFDGTAFVLLSQTPELIKLGELVDSSLLFTSNEVFHSISIEILNDSTAITGNYNKHSQQIEYEQVSINLDELKNIYVGNQLLFNYDEDNKSFSVCIYGYRYKDIEVVNGHQNAGFSLENCVEVEDILGSIITSNSVVGDSLSLAEGVMIFKQE